MKEDRYHHGDLRRALLDAALQLATERGLHGFTLREVARHAGVSHAAPYHHFADKAALVEALAVESFDVLATTLRAAWQGEPGSALDKLQAAGVAYVRFAFRNAASFRFMYRPELRQTDATGETPPGQSLVDQASLAAYQVLIDGIMACQEAGFIVRDDPTPLAFSAWVAMHGLATLLLDGAPGNVYAAEVKEETAVAMAMQVTNTLIQGLLLR